ncbi:MAG: TVP38/TMEM64 family protein [Kordiimonas sp.]
MKSLLKLATVLMLFFASTFLVVQATGVITPGKIETWLETAKNISPLYVMGIVVGLLFADLFIAVPTLTITIFAGYFLGHTQGAIAVFAGMLLAATTGYAVSYRYGPFVLRRIISDEKKSLEVKETFDQHGFTTILLARALPILPEVTACLAGITRMRFLRFFTAWSIGTIPYVLIATYEVPISSIKAPNPAIFTAIGITTVLWLAWLILQTKKKRATI